VKPSSVAPIAALTLLAASPTQAGPDLRMVQGAGLQMKAPLGWAVQSSNTPIAVLHAQARPDDPASPSLSFMQMPLSQGPQTPALMAEQAARQLFTKGFQVTATERLAGGVQLTTIAGEAKGVAAKMAAAVSAANHVGYLAVFAAPAKEFDRLGGAQLLMQAVGLQRQPALGAKGPRVQGGTAVQIPAAYRRSKTPALHYLVDRFEALSPAQVANLVGQMNDTGRLVLGISSAFASLVHATACQAAPQLIMSVGGGPTNCAQTISGWRSTVQLSGGNVQAALSEAVHQRNQLVVAWRCESGAIDKASCGAYRSGRAQYNALSHETSMRIITNLGGNGCLVGDANCVPY